MKRFSSKMRKRTLQVTAFLFAGGLYLATLLPMKTDTRQATSSPQIEAEHALATLADGSSVVIDNLIG